MSMQSVASLASIDEKARSEYIDSVRIAGEAKIREWVQGQAPLWEQVGRTDNTVCCCSFSSATTGA